VLSQCLLRKFAAVGKFVRRTGPFHAKLSGRSGTRPCRVHLQICAPPTLLNFCCNIFGLIQTRHLYHSRPYYRHHDYLQGTSLRPAVLQPDAQLTACSRPMVEAKLTWPAQDIITGDELISDSYEMKLKDGVMYEADCKKISVGGDNIDIGGNPSAEEAEETTEDASQTVLDIAHSFRLNETQFDKKSYLGHLKQYMKKVKETMKSRGASDESVSEFEKGAQGKAKEIVANFKDYEFLIGESMDPDGMLVDFLNMLCVIRMLTLCIGSFCSTTARMV